MVQGKDAVQGYFALRSDLLIGGAWLRSVLQKLEHARAHLANFLQVDLVRSKAVEEAVQAGHPIVPFPGNCVDGGLSLFVSNACLCSLGEKELGDFETSHQGRDVQRGSTIAIPCGRDGSVLEKKLNVLEPTMKGG